MTRPPQTLRKAIAMLACVAGLSACDDFGSGVSLPPVRPDPTLEQGVTPQSPESEAMAAYFTRVENNLVSQGLLRSDGGGPDVPFNARQLTENFIRIALYDEYVSSSRGLVARQNAQPPAPLGTTDPAGDRVRVVGAAGPARARPGRYRGLCRAPVAADAAAGAGDGHEPQLLDPDPERG